MAAVSTIFTCPTGPFGLGVQASVGQSLMQAALDIRLGTGFTPGALVDLLYGNLVGSPPAAADRAFWVGALTAGQFTPVSLSLAAADLDLNAQHIDLVGLMAHGLGYG